MVMVLALCEGIVFFYSPNLPWFCIAMFDYIVFPYDFEAAKVWAWDWILFRLAVNTGITFAYTGFWHFSTYWWGWAKRPFNNNRSWRWGKFAHNMWYTWLGCVQWTVFEAIFMYCYTTGRMPYLHDDSLFGENWWDTFNFIAWFFLVPITRDIHFYFAHRFIHISVLYKYVHSLHHRNTDIEPFAGLCMHPIEHLYYYACIFPSLYIFASPFA
eukprot:UN34737